MRDKPGYSAQILTIARWETRRSIISPGRTMLPAWIALMILLAGVTAFSAGNGLHVEDGLFLAGTDDAQAASFLKSDPRFLVYLTDRQDLLSARGSYDLIILDGKVIPARSPKGRAAASSLAKDHEQYLHSLYRQEEDIFAAYPIWIDTDYVRSEADFSSPGIRNQASSPLPQGASPSPEGPVEYIAPPPAGISLSGDDLRESLRDSDDQGTPLFRYPGRREGTDNPPYQTPSRLTPPVPFDSILLVFIFIFPLYFISQFFMMSIMHERMGRQGEALLSSPVRPWVIVAGKSLPYGTAMVGISALIGLSLDAPPAFLLPLIPVILFFIGSGLIIGMVARSFKELSFISIFFSTVVTVYLFFPSIFAGVHVVSLVSPLTLIVLLFQGESYTCGQYLYATALFFITSMVLLYTGIVNFREERLFSHERLTSKAIDHLGSVIRISRPFLSLFSIGMLMVPFVLMIQLMLLVLLFGLPMPLSIGLLLVSAAAVEEVGKSAGLYALSSRHAGFLTWKNLLIGAAATALGFLAAEKLLLLVTVSQIAESVFGTILFGSIPLLTIPFLIHFAGILATGTAIKLKGSSGLLPGILIATAIHCGCNVYLLRGWFL